MSAPAERYRPGYLDAETTATLRRISGNLRSGEGTLFECLKALIGIGAEEAEGPGGGFRLRRTISAARSTPKKSLERKPK